MGAIVTETFQTHSNETIDNNFTIDAPNEPVVIYQLIRYGLDASRSNSSI